MEVGRKERQERSGGGETEGPGTLNMVNKSLGNYVSSQIDERRRRRRLGNTVSALYVGAAL